MNSLLRADCLARAWHHVMPLGCMQVLLLLQVWADRYHHCLQEKRPVRQPLKPSKSQATPAGPTLQHMR